MKRKITLFNERKINYEKLFEIFQGWEAYARWADSSHVINKIIKKINLFNIH